MKINELYGLWVGYNEEEKFTILICAQDTKEAQEIANNYRLDSHMKGDFEITEFNDVNTQFDCDYVLLVSDFY